MINRELKQLIIEYDHVSRDLGHYQSAAMRAINGIDLTEQQIAEMLAKKAQLAVDIRAAVASQPSSVDVLLDWILRPN